jgi:hypothetical protein
MVSGVDGFDAGRVPTTAYELADAFEAGWWPPQIAVPIRLEVEEACYAQSPVQVFQFLEADSDYMHKYVGGLHPAVIPLKMMTALGNSMRKSKAAREGAAQWRPVDQGTVFITNRRLAVRGSQGWQSISYSHVMEASCDHASIKVQGEGMAPTMLAMPNADYLFVMFYRLAFNQILHPPAPLT